MMETTKINSYEDSGINWGTSLRRHSLVNLSDHGRHRALMTVPECLLTDVNTDLIKNLVLNGLDCLAVPGIVRRPLERMANNVVALGFSSPQKIKGRRLQIPVLVSQDDIAEVTTPYEVIQRPYMERTGCLAVLSELMKRADDIRISLGVWGSASLELYTGLAYTTENSDLDLITDSADLDLLNKLLETIKKLEIQFGTRIDIELSLPENGEVQLKELLSNSSSVLCKGISDVKIISKNTLLKELGNR